MDSFRFLRSSQVIILGVCIAAATIIASLILSRGFIRVMQMTREQIGVTGSANRAITSDYIVWRASFNVRDPDLAKAYDRLRSDLDKVRSYLVEHGVKAEEIVVPQVATQQLYKKDEHGNDTHEFLDYRLTQEIEVRSEAVEHVSELSRVATELINSGVQFNSGSPEFLYRKLDELKVEMLALATQNAKLRAEKMAAATGNRIGPIRSAKMGVFQITPVHSNEVTDWGVNDTSSLEKKVTAVVSASFAIE